MTAVTRRTMFLCFVLIVFSVFLTSCDVLMALLGLGEDDEIVDVRVDTVAPLTDIDLNVVGVRIVLFNNGTAEVTTEYSVFFSVDTTISQVNDIRVYHGETTIQPGNQKQIDISRAQLDTFIATNGVTLPAGDYYIGVFVDPDDLLVENNEVNNSGVSTGTFPIAAVYQPGTITFGVSNAAIFNGKNVYFGVIDEGGSPESTDNFLAWGNFTITSASGSAVAKTFDTEVDFIADGGSSYDIYFFIDVNESSSGDPATTGPDDADYADQIVVGPVNGNLTRIFNLSTEASSDFPGTITVSMTNAGDFNGKDVYFGVIDEGGNPESIDNFLAWGSFTIAGGTGSVVARDLDTDAIFYAPGGPAYLIYYFIDVNENASGDPATTGPDAGDVSGQASTGPVNGNQTVLIDMSEPYQIQGSIYASLVQMSEAAGGFIVMFVAEKLVVDAAESFLPEYIVGSYSGPVDSTGSAEGMLRVGYPPTDEIFYGTVGVEYRYYAAIDINGAVTGDESQRFNDPFDYVYGFDESQGDPGNYFTYEEYGRNLSFYGWEFDQNEGVIVELVNAAPYEGKTVYFSVTAAGGDPGSESLGNGTLIVDSGSGTAVIRSATDDWLWSGGTGDYDLYAIIDTNDDWVDEPGHLDLIRLVPFQYTEQPMTITIGAQVDFVLFLSEVTGIYCEDRTVFGEPSFGGEQVTIDLENQGVTAVEIAGQYVLRADYVLPVPNVAYPWLHIDYPQTCNISNLTTLVFSLNTTAETDFGRLEVILWPADGQGDGNNTIDYTPTVNGNWLEYRIPLADFGIDRSMFRNISIGWPVDSTGEQIACTLYFDGIYFE